jgi:sRNA-binding protein
MMTDQKEKAPADFSARAQCSLTDKEVSSPKPGTRPAEKLIADFAARWPYCFSVYEKRRRPLAIGIHEQIISALDGVASRREIKLALAFYTRNLKYLAALKAGVARIGLDGQPTGVVTAKEERPDVPRLIKARRRKGKPVRQTPKPANPTLSPSQLASPTQPHPVNADKPRLTLRGRP